MGVSLKNDSRQSGVTIAELLVVFVVIAVIAGFALIQKGGTEEQLKRQNAAQELKSAFERARFDSVKRRADNSVPSALRANVVVNASGFTLVTDLNQDGALNSADERSVDLSGSNIVIGGDEMTFPVTVSFDQRGEATAVDSIGDAQPIFLVCNVSCASPTGTNSNIVLITPTGTVNLLPGGITIPTFSPPAGITIVPPGDSINNQAAVTPTP